MVPTGTLLLIVSAYIFLHIRMHIAQPTPLQNCCLPFTSSHWRNLLFLSEESALPIEGAAFQFFPSAESILLTGGTAFSLIWSMHTAQCKEADEGQAPFKPNTGIRRVKRLRILKFSSKSQITNSVQQGLVETLQFNPKYCMKAGQP